MRFTHRSLTRIVRPGSLRACRIVRFCLAALIAFALALPAHAGVLLQGFYWDVPSPATGASSAPWWWDHLAAQAHDLSAAGFTAVWIPPALKGASGGYSVGYDPFDDYDMGAKQQKSTLPTRYGTREQLERCVAMLRANGLDVLVDIVDNHRNGDDGADHFVYHDAYGHPQGGRFPKGPGDFHPNVPQDPNVPDGNKEMAFGPDLAPINGEGHTLYQGLMDAGDWETRALGVQGYRLDFVRGISTDWLLPFLNYGAMQGKFAVGEFWEESDTDKISDWVWNRMRGRCSAFDFPLRALLRNMCTDPDHFDMASLDHAGLAGRDPFHAVTFVENHDTDRGAKIAYNKALAYAYILTSEGYPSVFYRDYSRDPGCYHMKSVLDKLLWVHEKLAAGPTEARLKSHDVFAYERLGGPHLLVGLNANTTASRTFTVQTGFGAHVRLRDYAGHAPDLLTDATGRAALIVPKNADGAGYVCYSRAGIGARLPQSGYEVVQEYDGAEDLDIRPADSTGPVRICRVWAAKGTAIRGSLTCNTFAWTRDTILTLEADGPTDARIAGMTYTISTPPGHALSATVPTTGWITFLLYADHTPSANPRPSYSLKLRYTAPQTFLSPGATATQPSAGINLR